MAAATAKRRGKVSRKAKGAKPKGKKRNATGGRKTSKGDNRLLVVSSAVRRVLASKGARMSGDLPEGLSRRVGELLTGALKRASDNGRQTVRPSDL